MLIFNLKKALNIVGLNQISVLCESIKLILYQSIINTNNMTDTIPILTSYTIDNTITIFLLPPPLIILFQIIFTNYSLSLFLLPSSIFSEINNKHNKCI